MSRPSTYEDVLLNPHMMELRFADNQKNNAKKKLDNRELAARRAQEFFIKHGTDPPPKTRTLRGAAKGSRNKRTASEVEEDETMGGEEVASPAVAAPSTNTRSAAKRRRVAATIAPSAASKGPLAKGKGKAVATPATASAKGIFVPPVSTQALVRATTQVLPPPMVGIDPKRAKQLESGKRQKQQYQHFQRLQDFNVQVEVAPEEFAGGFAAPEDLGMDTLDPRLREAGPSTVSAHHESHNPHQATSSNNNNHLYNNNPDFANSFLFRSEEEETQQWANNGQVAGPGGTGKSGGSSYNQAPDQEFVQNILNTNYEAAADATYASGQQSDLGNISAHHTSAELDWHKPESNYHSRPLDEDGNSFFDFEDASSVGQGKLKELEEALE